MFGQSRNIGKPGKKKASGISRIVIEREDSVLTTSTGSIAFLRFTTFEQNLPVVITQNRPVLIDYTLRVKRGYDTSNVAPYDITQKFIDDSTLIKEKITEFNEGCGSSIDSIMEGAYFINSGGNGDYLRVAQFRGGGFEVSAGACFTFINKITIEIICLTDSIEYLKDGENDFNIISNDEI